MARQLTAQRLLFYPCAVRSVQQLRDFRQVLLHETVLHESNRMIEVDQAERVGAAFRLPCSALPCRPRAAASAGRSARRATRTRPPRRRRLAAAARAGSPGPGNEGWPMSERGDNQGGKAMENESTQTENVVFRGVWGAPPASIPIINASVSRARGVRFRRVWTRWKAESLNFSVLKIFSETVPTRSCKCMDL